MCNFIGFWFETKFIGPSNSRGARIKATFYHANNDKTSVTVPYSYEHGGSDAHKVALLKLLEHPNIKELYPRYQIVAHTTFPKDSASYWWSVNDVHPND
jgi:hypothetical protein